MTFLVKYKELCVVNGKNMETEKKREETEEWAERV